MVSYGLPMERSPGTTSAQAPGSIQTLPVSINAAGSIAGYYEDGSAVIHGFVRTP